MQGWERSEGKERKINKWEKGIKGHNEEERKKRK